MNCIAAILILLLSPFALAEAELVREMKVPAEFAEAAEKEGLFKLGEVIYFAARLETLNDNILHGLAMASGATHFPNEVERGGPEGDDRSLTFKGKLVAEWGFEEGSLALEFFTANYSRLAYEYDEDGIARWRNRANNRVYTEHLIHNEAKVNFVQNLNGDYFMRITGSYASLDDHGIGYDIQDLWHGTSLQNVQYQAREHFDKQELYTVGVGLGRRIILKENGHISVELDLETGIEVSNIENVARSYNRSLQTQASWQTPESTRMHGVDNFAPYVDARLSLTAFKKLKAQAYARKNASGIKTTGYSLAYTFHPGKLWDVTLRTSVEKIEDAFNRIYRHDIGRSDRTYGLDLEIKRYIGER